MYMKNQGKPIGKTVRFSARELSIATNRPIGGNHYARLEQAFQRLVGTTFTTNIRTGGKIETRVFNLVESGGFVRTDDEKFRLDYCEVVLSDWFMRAIESNEVVTISDDYFRLRRPLERRLYEIARKHCGNQKRWHINLDTLQAKTGSNAPLKRFRLNLRQIIAEDHTPFYQMELTDKDLVIFRPRKPKIETAKDIELADWAIEKGREHARNAGWDFYVVQSNWQDMARALIAKGQPPKDANRAFVGYCKKLKSLR